MNAKNPMFPSIAIGTLNIHFCSVLDEEYTESHVGFKEVLARAAQRNCLSRADGERMLAEQEKIPAELRRFRILFAGKVERCGGWESWAMLRFDKDYNWRMDDKIIQDSYNVVYVFAYIE